ncbi:MULTISPECIES: hypothetical protein [Proteus]|uniref:hypothetical protein n=1 Tax=Proteus TaxID=583 RepID=UPI000D6869E4|nr:MULTISPECIES: hypothetical protein [Proteus]NBM98624.1 hypothetical protein [Proteus sp. G2660]
MLNGYIDFDKLEGEDYIKARKRLLAVQAALEIAKASAASGSATTGAKMAGDLGWAKQEVSKLADAIQEALES